MLLDSIEDHPEPDGGNQATGSGSKTVNTAQSGQDEEAVDEIDKNLQDIDAENLADILKFMETSDQNNPDATGEDI